MRRDPILFAWGIGLLLAVLVYLVGPDLFIYRALVALQELGWRLGEVLSNLSVVALDLVRAAAIGLYATFMVLAVAVARRGGPARGAMVVVTLLFLVLAGGSGLANTRWAAALVLSGIAAAVMTGRLRHAPAEVADQPLGRPATWAPPPR